MREIPVAPEAVIKAGAVVAAGPYAVGYSNGQVFTVSRLCRHLGADLAGGTIDSEGCLVCPWHHSAYDVATGRMVQGPQAAFARIPGLGTTLKALTRVIPLRRGRVTIRNAQVYVN